MADKAHILTDKELEKMERHLSAIYARAEKDVEAEFAPVLKAVKKKADELYKKIQDAEDEKSERDAKAAYKAFFVAEVLRRRDLSKASKNAQKRLYGANQEAARYINSKTAHIYTINYNQIGHGLQRDLDGYSFKSVSEEEAQKYGKISKQTVDKKKDTEWNAKNIRNAIVGGALLYYAAEKIFSEAAKSTARKNRDSADRQASDMLTDAENKGRLDSMYRAYDEGFEVKKYWVATLDNRTRETHIEYDGIGTVPLEYEYAPGLKKPRDPDCSIMAEVCNCRCRILYDTGHGRSATRASRWFKEDAGREGLENLVTGSYKKSSSFKGTETVSVPNMTYEEWMKWRSK